MQDETYALQHFGFTPTQVTLERKHLLKDLLEGAFDNMIKKATLTETIASRVETEKNKAIENIFNDLKTQLDDIEALDRKYFNIPPHVLLPCDFDHAKNCTEEMETEMDNEIQMYKQSFLENSIMISSLEQKESEFEKMKPLIAQHFQVVNKLEAATQLLNQNKLHNIQNLVDATAQVVKHLEQKESK